MAIALTNSIEGHREKYRHLSAHLPPEEVANTFVGGLDPVLIGFKELEFIRSYGDLLNASVVDIGCGIGRLTRHLVDEPIQDYLGTDVVPEILREANAFAPNDPRFRFEVVEECRIPKENSAASVVVGFSVITHLTDEDTFEYIQEAHRVLRPGGTAIFSFLDFSNEVHLEMFFRHCRERMYGHGDLIKFTTPDVLEAFAKLAGFSRTEFIWGKPS